ncbi:PIG-L family deacetylase [Actinacidiphila sp. bgisy160]|uniref:PIG-L family deacetylase n=1 Tax=Actinacidiphila sp. bgisy160 TaxID=3413796 RepID=UPI003D739BE0
MKIAPTRRRFLAGLAAGTAAVAVAGCSRSGVAATGPAPAPLAFRAAAGGARLLQVLAHPDDELYFMNPDTVQAVEAGVPVVSVYVTAGEAHGVNRPPGQPRPAPDKAAYSAARHQGLRQAYAAMLGTDIFTPWRRGTTRLAHGMTSEVDTLRVGDREAVLVFLNLAMHGSTNRVGLPQLWQLPGMTMPTFTSAGSPNTARGTYTHDVLVDVLTGLLERHRPTVVHTLDPDPDMEANGATWRRDIEQLGYSDHWDHTATALFTWKAIARHADTVARSEGVVPAFLTTAYRGYYNHHWPYNLPPALLRRKAGYLAPYGGAPDWPCGDPSGCGDYAVGVGRPLTNRKGWVRSTHYRHPGARLVPGTDAQGRLVAHGVLGTRAVRWRETAPGSGRWGPPRDLGGGPLAPALSVVTDPAGGGPLLFALRFASLDSDRTANTRDVVLLEEGRDWQGLGSPEDDPDRGRRIGVPVAVTAPDGRVHLFVRNAAKGLSTRVREPDGSWIGWQDLGGGQVQDGLSAVVDRDGRVHVFAAGRTAVHHWSQDAPGRPPVCRLLTALPVPADPPAATAEPDGSLSLVYRLPASDELLVHRLGFVRAALAPGRPRLFDGYGPLAQAHGLLAGRGADGSVHVAGLAHPAGALRRGAPAYGFPALHGRPGARPAVVGFGTDATPWIWRPELRTPV